MLSKWPSNATVKATSQARQEVGRILLYVVARYNRIIQFKLWLHHTQHIEHVISIFQLDVGSSNVIWNSNRLFEKCILPKTIFIYFSDNSYPIIRYN